MSQPLMKLTPAFSFKLPINPGKTIGPTPSGNRVYIPVLAGGKMFLQDETVVATFSEGGDFAILGEDGFAKLEVRVHAKTVNTNEMLYIHYTGHLEATPSVLKVIGFAPDAKSTGFDDQKLFISLNVETSAAEFAWMNRTVFVGRGRCEVEAGGSFVVYEVYKVSA